MKKIAVLLLAFGAIYTFNSCSEDFLDVPPYGTYTLDNLVTKDAINKLLIGCYSRLIGEANNHQDLFWGPAQLCLSSVHGGDLMKGGPSKGDLSQWQEYNEFKLTTGNAYILDYWKSGFDAIYRINLLLNQLDKNTDMTDAEKLQVVAQARFLRAHYYFYLKRTFNNIPFIDETMTEARQPNTVDNDGVTFVNIWPQICEDMDFARKNLPPTQTDLGRPNKWAADCYYAKLLIWRANLGDLTSAAYTEALTILNDAMANGVTVNNIKYALQPYYYRNFSSAYDNSSESVWALQCAVNDGVASTAGVFGAGIKGNPETKLFYLQATDGPGWGNGWGFLGPTQFWVDQFRTKPNGLPYLDYYATNPTSVKSDYGLYSTDPFTPDTVGLDPRLDWNVGRRGIPFLDYGIMPGRRWLRGPEIQGPYICKKFVIKNSEVGVYCTSKSAFNNSINVCIIRYPDVLLWAAECEARVGSLANARDLVNQVRNRMKQNSSDPNNWVKLADGVTNAANYRIDLYPSDGSADDAFKSIPEALQAILFERGLELGLEGHRFWDILRFGVDETYFPAWAAKQHEAMPGQAINTYVYTRVPDAYSPIPTTAIDNSLLNGVATLTQNPGY